MKPTSAAILIVGLVALTANAYAFPEEEARLDTTFDSAAQDAVYLGEVLRDVAQTLAEDEGLGAESDEYFFRALWNKTKQAVKDATQKVKVSVKEAKDNIKKAAKEAQQKLKDKAAVIMSKLFTKVVSGYALDYSESRVNVIKIFVNVIQRAAQRFMKMGKVLGQLEN